MYVLGYVRLGYVLGRQRKRKFFCLRYCVFCCEVETKSAIAKVRKTVSKLLELTI